MIIKKGGYMCNSAGIEFVMRQLSCDDIANKKVIEVGSQNINGSVRSYVEKCNPLCYVGVDVAEGQGVDEICDINHLISRFGKESFDIVICTEVLEHVQDWRNAIFNLKYILKSNGILVLTTRSYGFPYHGYPFDFWRYEIDDMRMLFSDLEINSNESDPSAPGVFIKATKPIWFSENSLEKYRLYSIIKHKNVRNITDFDLYLFKARTHVSRFLPIKLKEFLKKHIAL